MHDQLFMDLCHRLAQESTCLRARVGCVLTTAAGRILSTGYNGSPAGITHCHPATCGRHHAPCQALHAEQNAVAYLRSHHEEDKTCYLTHSPCHSCLKLLSAVRVRRVIYQHPYRDLDQVLPLAVALRLTLESTTPSRCRG